MPDDSEPGATTAPRDDTPPHTVVQVGVPDAVREAGALPAIPGYELHGEIGSGGMGVVYAARDLALNRSVAVKLLRHAFPVGGSAVQRFLDEAQITGQLQHPAIPPVHQVGTLADGRPFLVMKLIKGRTLHALLAERAAPADDRARFVAVFEQICLAVGYAHSRGVVHRDLKPANVMVGAFGEVQVMDWGLAKVVGAAADPRPDAPAPGTTIRSVRELGTETEAGSVLGSLAFMPPEQAGGEVARLDPRSDVFGLGAVLCAVLTGQPPYTGADVNEIHLKAIRGQTAAAFARLDACGAEPELVALAKRCLATDPAERPADGGAVAAVVASLRADAERRARQAELDRVRTEGELQAARATAVEQRKRRRVQLLLLASVALLALAGGAFAWWEDRRTTAAKTEEALRKGVEQAEDDRRKAHTEREVTAALAEMNALCDRGNQEIENPPRWRLMLTAARSAQRRAAAALGAGPATDELRATFAGATARLERDEFDCETAELCEKWFIDVLDRRGSAEDAAPALRRGTDELFARLGFDLAAAVPDAVVAALEKCRLRYQLTYVLVCDFLTAGDDCPPARKAVAERVAEQAHPLLAAARAAHRAGALRSFLQGEGGALSSTELLCFAIAGLPGEFGVEKVLYDEAIRRNPANLVALAYRGQSPEQVAVGSFGDPPTEIVWVTVPPAPGTTDYVWLRKDQIRTVVASSNALTLRRDLPVLWRNAGRTDALSGLHDSAVERYRHALLLDPTRADDHIHVANAFKDGGRLAEAVAEYRLVLARFPELVKSKYPEVLTNAARCAVLLACEREDGKKLPPEQRRELRIAALGWLRQWARENTRTGKEVFIVRNDPALRCVRDPEHLHSLPPEEIGRWTAHWDEMRALKTTGGQRFALSHLAVIGPVARGLAPPPREVKRP